MARDVFSLSCHASYNLYSFGDESTVNRPNAILKWASMVAVGVSIGYRVTSITVEVQFLRETPRRAPTIGILGVFMRLRLMCMVITETADIRLYTRGRHCEANSLFVQRG